MARLALPREIERGFWRLIGQGWKTERAAISVGVAVSTGKLWFRNGGGMAPMASTEPSNRYLSQAEREVIDLCWAGGWNQADIAREIGRAPSTV
jgi:DNA-binding NarL/FixJ family response regulator